MSANEGAWKNPKYYSYHSIPKSAEASYHPEARLEPNKTEKQTKQGHETWGPNIYIYI